ncbi:LysR family transcriptional regulator, partial [Bacillus sp. LR--39]
SYIHSPLMENTKNKEIFLTMLKSNYQSQLLK